MQTIGMNVGYFTSFTVFLALNDAEFCNAHLRPAAAAAATGLLSLAAYLRFWAAVYLAVTVVVWFFKAERPARSAADGVAKPCAPPPPPPPYRSASGNRTLVTRARVNRSCRCRADSGGGDPDAVAAAYARLWAVVRLPAVLRLSAVLVTCRLGFLAAEAAAPLKLLEKGVSKVRPASRARRRDQPAARHAPHTALASARARPVKAQEVEVARARCCHGPSFEA